MKLTQLKTGNLGALGQTTRWQHLFREKRCLGGTFGSSCVYADGALIGVYLMRASLLATIFAFGSVIAVPALAQQSTGTSSQQQMQDEADKGIKTRNSGESGYVGEQEKPGAASRVPGQPDTKSNQTTTGASSAVGKSGGVSVGEQEKKAANPAESSQITSGKVR